MQFLSMLLLLGACGSVSLSMLVPVSRVQEMAEGQRLELAICG